jgi:membrane associated rhomboid family serine protease
VFVYQLSLGAGGQAFIFAHGLVPNEFSFVTLITSMFLHGGLLHFGGNMLYLWIFGDNVEDRMGHARFIAFYVLCGIAAALAQTFANPDSPVPMVGASGAIAGVMGAYIVMYPRSRIVTLIPIFIFIQLVEVPAVIFLGLWFLLQFISGLGSAALSPGADMSGGIAFWAHVAGFVAGMATVQAFRRPERQRVEWWHDA